MMENNPEKTIEEKILKKLKIILNRLDEIEKKLAQLDDPYNLNDYFRAQNNKLPNGDSTSSYKLSDRFDIMGALK